MKSARDVIIEPVISEKTYALLDEGRYTFEVAPWANKIEIRHAVEELWGVAVTGVNTLNRKGKPTRFGLQRSRHSDTKRAIVTLAPGEEIDIFDAG